MTASTTNHPHDPMAPRERPKQRRATDPNMGRSIFVFCDGTGKDGRDPERKCWLHLGRGAITSDVVFTQKTTESPPTYIERIIKKASTETTTGRPIGPDERFWLPFYVAGVGAGSAFRNPAKILDRIFGAAIVDSIITAYLHISETYKAGDDIYLFGYSRGAFVARKVASLIYRFGLEIKDRAALIKRWSRHEKPVPWDAPNSTHVGKYIRIKCLVAWDTVGAVFKKTCTRDEDLFGIPDTELPPNVDSAFHAMAFHENRRLFRATLFKPNSMSKLKEVWFPGAHADVGGGGDSDTKLPNISLLWVIGEMAEFMKIPNEELTYPDPSTIIPTDAYHESSPARRLVDHCETRLQSGLLKHDSLIHETVAYMRNAPLATLDPRPRKTSHLLSINDMSILNWDIKAYLVACNTLESVKRSATMTKRMVQDQVRSRVSSLRNLAARTPRLSNAPLPPTSLREPNTPRPQASSTFIPRTSQNHEAQTPPALAPAPTTSSSSRHRTESTYSRQRVDTTPSRQRVDSNASRQHVDSHGSRQHIRLDVPPPMTQWSQLDTSRGGTSYLAVPAGVPSIDRTRKTSSRSAMGLKSSVHMTPPSMQMPHDLDRPHRHRSRHVAV
ncbi:choline transport protein [Ceratobasidium sp. AG-Ba]|nr:choline transport protein [Ceratobasidium sp. AG-Ba]QRW01212.1 choline transport protein [Ceratobasidium sp. AG-Ba]